MSVMAYKDGVLVTDTGTWRRGFRLDMEVCKIWVDPQKKYAAGFVGKGGTGQKFLEWASQRADDDRDAPRWNGEENDCEGWLVFPDSTIWNWDGEHWDVDVVGCDAIGAGANFVLPAMLAGASALEACEAAVRYGQYVASPLMVLDFETWTLDRFEVSLHGVSADNGV